MHHEKIVRRLVAVAASGLVAGAMVAMTAGAASATYGPTAQYQVELSANIPGNQGGGVWLWIALSNQAAPGQSDVYVADYAGSDCGHGGEGAAADAGDATWHYMDSAHSMIEIDGVALNGLGGFPTVITVPATRGHYTGTDQTFLTLPPFIPGGIGFSQLQVATVPPHQL